MKKEKKTKKFLIAMEPSLFKKLEELAIKDGRSISAYIRKLIKEKKPTYRPTSKQLK